MPTTYAHYTFGVEVFKNLNDELKELISKNINLYNVGLHGPDILFYYGALSSNAVNQKGNEIHSKKADSFFENARSVIAECDDKEAACAYIMGFICHFMLDSECHPFIRQKESIGYSHSEMEAEFDRLLMIKNHLNPISYKTSGHIIPTYDYAKCISLFYEGITYKEILKALKSMKFYLNFLVAPGHLKRAVIFNGLKVTGNYEKMSKLIMSYEPNSACVEISENLLDLYSKAIIPTANIINEYYENLNSTKSINTRFNKSFE